MQNNPTIYEVQKLTFVQDQTIIGVLYSGSYDGCKDFLLLHYGRMPLSEFLSLDITIN